MIISDSIEEVRNQVRAWQGAGEKVAFVPTMGNLHQGHLSLIRRGMELADHVVSSIFVNPLQFGDNEDLSRYPSTPEQDKNALEQEGCDLLFLPSEQTIYPAGRDSVTTVDVPDISNRWCGASRPGHFRGVCTVVCKLFNIVPADYAIFGQKDYQQLAIIRRMVDDLNISVQIIGMDTVREESGLAMSSRNGYLTDDEKNRAVLLYQTLLDTRQSILLGERGYLALESKAKSTLSDGGFIPDYFAICRQNDLEPASLDDHSLVILAAATIGRARLIDNITLELQDI